MPAAALFQLQHAMEWIRSDRTGGWKWRWNEGEWKWNKEEDKRVNYTKYLISAT